MRFHLLFPLIFLFLFSCNKNEDDTIIQLSNQFSYQGNVYDIQQVIQIYQDNTDSGTKQMEVFIATTEGVSLHFIAYSDDEILLSAGQYQLRDNESSAGYSLAEVITATDELDALTSGYLKVSHKEITAGRASSVGDWNVGTPVDEIETHHILSGYWVTAGGHTVELSYEGKTNYENVAPEPIPDLWNKLVMDGKSYEIPLITMTYFGPSFESGTEEMLMRIYTLEGVALTFTVYTASIYDHPLGTYTMDNSYEPGTFSKGQVEWKGVITPVQTGTIQVEKYIPGIGGYEIRIEVQTINGPIQILYNRNVYRYTTYSHQTGEGTLKYDGMTYPLTRAFFINYGFNKEKELYQYMVNLMQKEKGLAIGFSLRMWSDTTSLQTGSIEESEVPSFSINNQSIPVSNVNTEVEVTGDSYTFSSHFTTSEGKEGEVFYTGEVLVIE